MAAFVELEEEECRLIAQALALAASQMCLSMPSKDSLANVVLVYREIAWKLNVIDVFVEAFCALSQRAMASVNTANTPSSG